MGGNSQERAPGSAATVTLGTAVGEGVGVGRGEGVQVRSIDGVGVGATVGVLGGGSTLSRPRLSATTSPTVITAARISTAVARMPTRIATVGPGSGGAGCQASRWCEEGGGGTQAGGLPGGFCGGAPH